MTVEITPGFTWCKSITLSTELRLLLLLLQLLRELMLCSASVCIDVV